MTARSDYRKAAPAVLAAMRGLEDCVRQSELDTLLLELVRMRVSQINGCTFCLDMHTRDARKVGVAQQKMDRLAAWREAPGFSARERAALAYAEALSLIAQHGVDDTLYAEVSAHFDAAALAQLSLAIIAINGWNRLAIAFRTPLQQTSG
jgi:AhpD family alkylhydroperoxidase